MGATSCLSTADDEVEVREVIDKSVETADREGEVVKKMSHSMSSDIEVNCVYVLPEETCKWSQMQCKGTHQANEAASIA